MSHQKRDRKDKKLDSTNQKAKNKPLLRHKGLKDFGTHIKYEVTLFEYILSVNFQSVLTSLRHVKFSYSEKAAQFCKISTLDLTVCCKSQILIGDFEKNLWPSHKISALSENFVEIRDIRNF